MKWMLRRAVLLLALMACSKTAASPLDQGELGIVEGPIVETETHALYVGRSLIDMKHVVAKLGYDWRERTKNRRVRVVGTTIVYQCGDNEHCLVGGETHFRTVEKIDILPGENKEEAAPSKER